MFEIMAATPTWAELMGSNNWEGLLEPLNLNLRRLILQCGDLAEATYDAFNNDKNSKYRGTCRYGKDSFFKDVMLDSASEYQVVDLLYATNPTANPVTTNWMGYIAITNDDVSQERERREIYVAWRGTKRFEEWRNNYDTTLVPVTPLLPKEAAQNEAKVMKGWLSIYTTANPSYPITTLSAREQLKGKINELINKYKNENLSITFIGHNIGGSISILSAFDLAVNGIRDIPITSFVFGCPHVGDEAFDNYSKQFPNLKILHTRNKSDIVPLYPSDVPGYVDSGIVFSIDSQKSTFLKNVTAKYAHELQGMLHTVAGWNGNDGEFELKVERSLSLVNKPGNYLMDKFLIPESWDVEKNTGMVLNEKGEWVLAPPEGGELHVTQY